MPFNWRSKSNRALDKHKATQTSLLHALFFTPTAQHAPFVVGTAYST